MELNMVSKGIILVGTTIKSLNIENNIVEISADGQKSFGLNINEPEFQNVDNRILAQMVIDFDVEINQPDDGLCKFHLSLEGAFVSEEDANEDTYEELVAVNGAAALVGIARGKIESISASIFHNGKIVIPFVNVVDYYKSINE